MVDARTKLLKESVEEREKESAAVKLAVEEERKEFKRLEHRAEANTKELEEMLQSMAKAQKALHAKIREKRFASEQKASSHVPSRPEKESEEEVTSDDVVVKKSDGLKRLERMDERLFEYTRKLVATTAMIQKKAEGHSAANPPSPKKKEYLQRKLNGSLSNFQGLLRLRARFRRLAWSLTPAEKMECNEGIVASLENFAQLFGKAKGLMQKISEALVTLPEQAIPEKKSFDADVVALIEETLVEEAVPEHLLALAYPYSLQERWKDLAQLPGELSLFGDVVIDFFRPVRNGSGALSVFHFASSCRTTGEILDANPKFHVTKFDPTQCRQNVSESLVVSAFLSGPLDKNHIPKKFFFTCDCVLADKDGNVEELVEGGLKDIKDGSLRSRLDPALTLKENPEAVLIAILRMSKQFVPDTALFNALYHWQPEAEFNVAYAKVVLAEHFKQLYMHEREAYVDALCQFDLVRKMFQLDFGALASEQVLKKLEALVLVSQVSTRLELWRTRAPQPVQESEAPRMGFSS
jgi:hypothetical protein